MSGQRPPPSSSFHPPAPQHPQQAGASSSRIRAPNPAALAGGMDPEAKRQRYGHPSLVGPAPPSSFKQPPNRPSMPMKRPATVTLDEDGEEVDRKPPKFLPKPPPPPLAREMGKGESRPSEQHSRPAPTLSQSAGSANVDVESSGGHPPAPANKFVRLITPELMRYVETFKFPFVDDVSVYDLQNKIGQGTFGVVYKAVCKRTKKLVALKRILLEHEKEGFPITALREIKMLQQVKHDNVTELLEICTGKGTTPKERFSFYLVFTFCTHDLAGLLANGVSIKLVHIKTMMRHILMGLNKLHTTSILHRDMKTANVLISTDGVLKLADFGLARVMYKQQNPCYTYRVVTLWYRPPELLLGYRSYGPAIDIWGAGCIMAELWTRSPILQGETEQGQLVLISKLCGSLLPSSWPGVDQMPFYQRLQLPQNYTRRLREALRSYMLATSQHGSGGGTGTINEAAMTLVDNMLTLDPAKRPTAADALDSTFFFEHPRFEDNIRSLIATLPGNMFEYTSGTGAHAHRGRQQQHQGPSAASNQTRHPQQSQAAALPNQSRQQQQGQSASSNQPRHNQQQSVVSLTQPRQSQSHAGGDGQSRSYQGGAPQHSRPPTHPQARHHQQTFQRVAVNSAGAPYGQPHPFEAPPRPPTGGMPGGGQEPQPLMGMSYGYLLHDQQQQLAYQQAAYNHRQQEQQAARYYQSHPQPPQHYPMPPQPPHFPPHQPPPPGHGQHYQRRA